MHRIKAPWEIERRLLVKAEEKTNFEYGCKPEERSLKDHIRLGIINLDKTAGPSSHEVTAWVKRILNLINAGHGGTLEASSWKPGKSQGNRCFTHRSRGSDKNHSSAPAERQRICQCASTPQNNA